MMQFLFLAYTLCLLYQKNHSLSNEVKTTVSNIFLIDEVNTTDPNLFLSDHVNLTDPNYFLNDEVNMTDPNSVLKEANTTNPNSVSNEVNTMGSNSLKEEQKQVDLPPKTSFQTEKKVEHIVTKEENNGEEDEDNANVRLSKDETLESFILPQMDKLTVEISNNNEEIIPKEISTVSNNDGIISFTEWKSQLKSNLNDESEPIKKNSEFKTNYASVLCGARIVDSVKNSKHVGYALIAESDLYALFPCIDNTKSPLWFIIQLCEPVTITQIEISNMELFSSYVKRIRLYISAHELTFDDSRWRNLSSDMFLEDMKQTQKFAIEPESDIFVRYVKVEILEHHKLDIFCPVTDFKVFGRSFSEEFSGNYDSTPDNSQPMIQNFKNYSDVNHDIASFFGDILSTSCYILVSEVGQLLLNMFKIIMYFLNKITFNNITMNSGYSYFVCENELYWNIHGICCAYYMHPSNISDCSICERCNRAYFQDFCYYYCNLTKRNVETQLIKPESTLHNNKCGLNQSKTAFSNLTLNLTLKKKRKKLHAFLESEADIFVKEKKNLSVNNGKDKSYDYKEEMSFGIISKMKKNLTLTMEYLEDMSIRFRNSIQDLKREIVNSKNDAKIMLLTEKVESLNKAYYFLNDTVANILIECKKSKATWSWSFIWYIKWFIIFKILNWGWDKFVAFFLYFLDYLNDEELPDSICEEKDTRPKKTVCIIETPVVIKRSASFAGLNKTKLSKHNLDAFSSYEEKSELLFDLYSVKCSSL